MTNQKRNEKTTVNMTIPVVIDHGINQYGRFYTTHYRKKTILFSLKVNKSRCPGGK